MTRTYELCFIVEPHRSPDEAQAICDRYTGLVADSGATITHVYPWGKRKLAYPIRKFREGIYFVVYVSADGQVPWPDVERLMMQDEKVLRHLVVRTDEDIKRALRKGKVPPPQPMGLEQPAADAAGVPAAESR